MDAAINTLLPGDWEIVREIYVEGLATGLSTFETKAPEWAEWDAAHLPSCRLAACLGGRLVGWTAMSPVSLRAAYAGVAEVSIYVASAARGLGVGKALLNALVSASEQVGGGITLWLYRLSGNRKRIINHYPGDIYPG